MSPNALAHALSAVCGEAEEELAAMPALRPPRCAAGEDGHRAGAWNPALTGSQVAEESEASYVSPMSTMLFKQQNIIFVGRVVPSDLRRMAGKCRKPL